MFCTVRQVIFIHPDQVDKTCSSTLSLVSSQSLLLEYVREHMDSLRCEFTLYGSQNECSRTNYLVSPYLRSARERFPFVSPIEISKLKISCRVKDCRESTIL